jgi:hypothetical protein
MLVVSPDLAPPIRSSLSALTGRSSAAADAGGSSELSLLRPRFVAAGPRVLAAVRLAQAPVGMRLLGATMSTLAVPPLSLLVQVLAARRPVAALAWRRRALRQLRAQLTRASEHLTLRRPTRRRGDGDASHTTSGPRCSPRRSRVSPPS